jgi:lysophospholipase L1-like esterase
VSAGRGDGPASIVCYGDSNTWGCLPMTDEVAVRLAPDLRWPGVLARTLGERARVHEAGLPGRTTVLDDPLAPHRNGAALLVPTLLTHAPVDVLVLALGTNDLKRRFGSRAYDAAAGVTALVRLATAAECGPGPGIPPRILVVAPAPLRPTGIFREMFAAAEAESDALAGRYRELAAALACEFLDADEHVAVSGVDGVHLDAEAHAVLGGEIAAVVTRMLAAA